MATDRACEIAVNVAASAVVQAIFLVIAIDALFAILYYQLNI